ncbi:hypothetical protein PLICRDRAFT_38855 [Plicaturopsis crispa FD-325 SS-3]|nr:hypothetical protein PLICRDRAFT_38855 [Plicaturopsis crispa FD-325 SS-3]
MSAELVPSVIDVGRTDIFHNRSPWSILSRRPVPTHTDHAADVEPEEDDPELLLPKRSSLVIVLLENALLQVSFFIIVSSSNLYAEYLGGSATFSGLVIGIPTVFSGLALIPLTRMDKGSYSLPLNVACCTAILGNIMYALAYRAHFLYLILIGRIVCGFAFTGFMYSKRYCSDPRIVGVRRRTTLAGWNVVCQGFGFTAGPFIGGLLYKIGFPNSIFNGYTSPAWVMAGAFAIFWAVSYFMFEDVQTARPTPSIPLAPIRPSSPSESASISPPSHRSTSILPVSHEMDADFHLSGRQLGVVVCMCWYAMTCFFILGGWEANIPVFTSFAFKWSPFAAGNFIALGGVTAFPFLFMNIYFARRVQDRQTLAIGSSLGLSGLLIMLALLRSDTVNFGSLYVCWFLVALGFNLASTVTLSLLAKQLPGHWNGRISLIIQYSNYLGRVTGAVWGGAGVHVGMMNYVGLQIAIVGVGALMHMTLWTELKAKTG